ncbi:MAG: ABC transporter ATP-binding protein, partial [Woeseiaceae bacterium]|nr:ABC transporter ATP-binding protein [Woeseiaceae bacterium]
VFEDDGRVQEYVGGYSDWLRRGHGLAVKDNPGEKERRRRAAAERRKSRKPTKLSYKDQRELDALPAEIEQIETDIETMQQEIAAPGFYEREAELVQQKVDELGETESLLERRIERWSELEMRRESFLE